MPSNVNIWDADQIIRHVRTDDESTLFGLNFTDPYTEMFVKDSLRQEESFSSVQVVLGKTLSPQWIEDKIFTMDLFSSSEVYFVIEAHEINDSTTKFISENLEKFTDNKMYFWFRKKHKLFEKLKKSDAGQVYGTVEPKFWEYNKLLDFLLRSNDIRLSPASENLILEGIEQNVECFYRAVEKLKPYAQAGQAVSDEVVKSIFTSKRLDQFELVQHFGRKELIPFFKKLMIFSNDYPTMDSFFYFLESHVIKLIDPSYIDKKPRPTKYDKQILQHSQIWKREELNRFLSVLNKWMVLSKKKDASLGREIRLAYLKIY